MKKKGMKERRRDGMKEKRGEDQASEEKEGVESQLNNQPPAHEDAEGVDS